MERTDGRCTFISRFFDNHTHTSGFTHSVVCTGRYNSEEDSVCDMQDVVTTP